MTEDVVPLDGNAMAGRLGQFFSFDVTSAMVTCADCALEGPLAELLLYGRDTAFVLRCRSCGAVNVRVLEANRVTNLDLSGLARIQVPNSEV